MRNRRRLTRAFKSAVVFPWRKRAIAAAVAAALVCGLLAAGCGSSSKTTASTATAPTPTKPQFIAQANAICAAGNRALTASQKALERVIGNKPPSSAQVTTYVNSAFAPAIQSQLDGIKALGAPPGEEAKVASMLNLAQEDLNKVKANPAGLLSGQTESLHRLRTAGACVRPHRVREETPSADPELTAF